MKQTLWSMVIAVALIGGCSGPVDDAPLRSVAPVASISWHQGSVESAFEVAEASNRPLYLYWGAVWCPPCQEIKNTVFLSQQFIAQSKLFMPVYLDGDTERAQSWGETFGVQGYPTMIVFSPMGEEVTRIPGGIDISRYNSVLATSLDAMTPTAELIASARAAPETLTRENYLQLAYYSWGQDFAAVPSDVNKAQLLNQLAAQSKGQHPEPSARLYMSYLLALLEEEAPASDSTGQAFARLSEILNDPVVTLACWDSLAYFSEEILALDIFTSQNRATLRQHWHAAVYALRLHPSLSTAEQLAG